MPRDVTVQNLNNLLTGPAQYWKAKTRLNKGKDLEEPIFSKGKVSDIGPCCQKLNIHVNDLHSNLTTLSTGHPLTVGAFHGNTKIRGKLNKTWQDIVCVVNRTKPTSFPSFTQQRINYFANRPYFSL